MSARKIIPLSVAQTPADSGAGEVSQVKVDLRLDERKQTDGRGSARTGSPLADAREKIYELHYS